MTLKTAALALLGAAQALAAGEKRLNGFDISGALVPPEKILRGGPPVDGIPALTDPRFLPASASWLKASDRVIGVAAGGVAKAYPIRILNWHEIVNDEVGGRRLAVTYCPLCGSGMVFDAEAGGIPREFGVSGLLYNSDVLLYDRQTRSLWSQIMKKAVTGPSKGLGLRQIPAQHTTWAAWRKEHPKTLVMSRDTGHPRDYDRDPYAGYEDDPSVFFPVQLDGRLHPKAWVLGLASERDARAYPVDVCPGRPFTDTLDGRRITIVCDRATRTARALDAEGRELPGTLAYWFAWAAFHPHTGIYKMDASDGRRP